MSLDIDEQVRLTATGIRWALAYSASLAGPGAIHQRRDLRNAFSGARCSFGSPHEGRVGKR